MKRYMKLCSKWIAFICILSICIGKMYQIIIPKALYDNTWPTTTTYLGFYEMEENTVDVLFLGSSHAATFFIPQELYDRYGITSYNLGCEQQNLVTSYFWLKEALRFQQPKVVILDCYFLFQFDETEPLNSTESCTRKAMDYMKWSNIKREAVKTICTLDKKQSWLSYYFPNIRYHTRWMELTENDFRLNDMRRHYELKGYAPLVEYSGRADFVPFDVDNTKGEEEMMPLMREYLDKIVDLCGKEGIFLILTQTPSITENIERYNAIQRYANDKRLLFLDFNERSLYSSSNYCYERDNHDDGHGNIRGAEKVTDFLGTILTEQNEILKKEDEQWESTKTYYQGIKKDCEIPYIMEFDTYLYALKDERYSIFISTKDKATMRLKDSTIQKLRDLGLRAKFSREQSYSYIAVIADGQIVELSDCQKISYGGSFRDGLAVYDIISEDDYAGNRCSIVIENSERSKNHDGFNIVVYNDERMKIVDSVCFDICGDETVVIR